LAETVRAAATYPNGYDLVRVVFEEVLGEKITDAPLQVSGWEAESGIEPLKKKFPSRSPNPKAAFGPCG
jgi:hypothetical protein